MSSSFEANPTNQPRYGAIVLACFVGFLVGEIVASVLETLGAQWAHFAGGLSALAKLSAPPWWATALGLVGLWCGFLGTYWFARSAGELPDMPRQWAWRTSDVGYVALGVFCQLVIDVLYAPFHFKSLNKPVHHLFGGANGASFVLISLMTTVGAPLVEEIFFRGVLFRALDSGLSSHWKRTGTVVAGLVSACLFALAHAEPIQFVGLALLGVVLAFVVKRTQRLIPSVLTHASFNAVALVSLIAQRSGH